MLKIKYLIDQSKGWLSVGSLCVSIASHYTLASLEDHSKLKKNPPLTRYLNYFTATIKLTFSVRQYLLWGKCDFFRLVFMIDNSILWWIFSEPMSIQYIIYFARQSRFLFFRFRDFYELSLLFMTHYFLTSSI